MRRAARGSLATVVAVGLLLFARNSPSAGLEDDGGPFASSTLAQNLAGMCGEMVPRPAVGNRTIYESGRCRLEASIVRPLFQLRVLDADTSAATDKLSAEKLEARGAEAEALLVSFGFDAAEFGSRRTRQVASVVLADGEPPGPEEFLDSKTFVQREIDGARSQSDRLVVSYAAGGELSGVAGRWTPLSADIVVTDLAPPMAVEEAAAVVGSEVVFVGPVLVVDEFDAAGAVTRARRVTEVLQVVDDESKLRATYLENGVPIPPDLARDVTIVEGR